MARRITKLLLDRIDLVDRGANPGAVIVVAKRDTPTKRVAGEDLSASAFAYVGDPSRTETWKLPIRFSSAAKSASHIRNALARFNQTEGIPASERPRVLARLRAAAKAHGIHATEKSMPDETIEKASQDYEDADERDDEDEEEDTPPTKRRRAMAKRDATLDAELAKREAALTAITKRAEAAEARIAKMEDERERERYIKKAAQWPSFGPAEDTGELLRLVAKAVPAETFAAFEQRLTGLERALKDARLFKSVGADGAADEGSSPEAQLDAMAHEIAKRDGVTFEAAYDRAITTPDGKRLYTRSIEEGR